MSPDDATPYLHVFDRLQPALNADAPYTIAVNHALDGIETETFFQPVVQEFVINAPRFTIDPAQVHAVFPPANATGRFDEVLPHVTLDNPILPWERTLAGVADGTPWLALLLFRPGELPVDRDTGSSTVDGTVADLVAASSTVVKPAIDPHTLDSGVLAGPCRLLTVPGQLFTAIRPTVADLPYLAHARQIDESCQPASAGTGDGWYSVAVANRFPDASGGVHEAHLVSLEGLVPYLQAGAQLPTLPDGTAKPVMLSVLLSWQFTAIPDTGETFGDLVGQLAADPHTLLRVPPPDPVLDGQERAAARLADGYIALPYGLETGEQTFGWYRGPLTPVRAQPIPSTIEHFASADEALAYVETDGVFDISYAAAWSAGRAIALADGAFGPTLLGFRRASRNLVSTLVQRLAAQGLTGPADIARLLAATPVRAAFDALLSAGLGATITDALAAPAGPASIPAVVPAAPTDPVAALDALLAAPDIAAALAVELQEQLRPVGTWLARLRLLYALPFAHVVPDERMLPAGSVRFFHIDAGWLAALTDGALSLGIEGTADATVAGLLRGVIDDAVVSAALSYRRGQPGTPDLDDPLAPLSGVLVRSPLVAGWPGLNLFATQAGKPLDALRIDHLATDVLLALFLGVPDTITLGEPQQGLHFGVEDGDVIQLRATQGQVGRPTGTNFPTSNGFAQFLRPVTAGVGAGVLTIDDGTATCLAKQLGAALGLATMGSGEFALQMIKGAEQQSFVVGA